MPGIKLEWPKKRVKRISKAEATPKGLCKHRAGAMMAT
jgi:hypothetical protein